MSLGKLRAVLITDPLIVLATIFFGSVSLAVSFFDHNGRKQIEVARSWSRALLRIAGVRVIAEGVERIDPNGSYVFASNHASYMDTPTVLANIPVQFRFLAKKELFRIPFLGNHLQRAGHIAVPRGNPREAIKTMAESAKVIRERGISVLIFPEGGRSLEGLQEFKEGAAFIAIKAGVPIVPVALTGTMQILPMHSGIIKPGTVRLRVGEPIPTEGLAPQDRHALTEQIHAKVREMLG